MNIHATNEIIMCFPLLHLDRIREFVKETYLLTCIVIIHSNIHVITAKNNPLLSGNEFAAAHGLVARLEVISNLLLFKIKYNRFSGEKTEKNPWLGWVIINTLYTVTLLKY